MATYFVSFFKRWCRMLSDFTGLWTKTSTWHFVDLLTCGSPSWQNQRMWWWWETWPLCFLFFFTDQPLVQDVSYHFNHKGNHLTNHLAKPTTHLNPQEMLSLQASGSLLSSATLEVCGLMWATPKERDREEANECRQQELSSINNAIASADRGARRLPWFDWAYAASFPTSCTFLARILPQS